MLDDEILTGKTSPSVTFSDVTRDMNGKSVKCVALNKANGGSEELTGSAVHKLNVYCERALAVYHTPVICRSFSVYTLINWFIDAPKFTVTADNTQVDIGDTVSLVCEVDGNPSPSIIWMKVGGSSRIYSSSNELKINSVTDDDIGAYECIGTVTNFPNAVHTAYILKKGNQLFFMTYCLNSHTLLYALIQHINYVELYSLI